ncbi:MAG: DUF3990 domain-containing protein [Fibromonadaceae bacterium]|jgi:hypothetical protein|nr:DUF3990 domain-containing protein [Fibromonadaceae bacterium]
MFIIASGYFGIGDKYRKFYITKMAENHTIKLYHGSNQAVEQPQLLKPTHPMDFGAGFYTTTNYQQALDFAKKVAIRQKIGKPTITAYEAQENILRSKYKILEFYSADKAWLDFVTSNRQIFNPEIDAEIVIGAVANDDIIEVVRLYENGVYTVEETLKRLKIKTLYNQYVFRTQGAINELITKEVINV